MTSSDQSTEYANQRDADVFWAAVRPADEPMRHRWFLPAIVLILTVSVPWYLPRHVGDQLLRGLPLWTWITVVCAFLLAAVTAWASLRLWSDEPDDDEQAGDAP